MAHRVFDIDRQGCSCKIKVWHGGQGVLASDQQYCAIWHAATAMDIEFSPVFGGELHVYVGSCSRTES